LGPSVVIIIAICIELFVVEFVMICTSIYTVIPVVIIDGSFSSCVCLILSLT